MSTNTKPTSVIPSEARDEGGDLKSLKISCGQSFDTDEMEATDGAELVTLSNGDVVLSAINGQNPFERDRPIYLTKESAIAFFEAGLAYLKGESQE